MPVPNFICLYYILRNESCNTRWARIPLVPNEIELDLSSFSTWSRKVCSLNTYLNSIQPCWLLLEAGHTVFQFLTFLQLRLCETVWLMRIRGNWTRLDFLKKSEKFLLRKYLTLSFALSSSSLLSVDAVPRSTALWSAIFWACPYIKNHEKMPLMCHFTSLVGFSLLKILITEQMDDKTHFSPCSEQ